MAPKPIDHCTTIEFLFSILNGIEIEEECLKFRLFHIAHIDGIIELHFYKMP